MNIQEILGGTLGGQLMQGGLQDVIGGTLGGQAIQDPSGIPGASALLGLLSPMLLGGAQGAQAGQPAVTPVPTADQQGALLTQGQIAPAPESEPTETPLGQQSKMRRYQSAMRAADAARSGDIMSLVETLIMESD